MIYLGGFILAGYLCGGIPFGLLIPRLYGVPDIRKVGSGNVGATNVLRACGPSGALFVTILDIAKGAVPVFLAGYYYNVGFSLAPEYIQLAVGFASILGHIFPVYLKFKGGKGVNTALGVFLVLIPIPTLIALLVFIIVVVLSKYVSLGSISASAGFFASIVILHYSTSVGIHDVYIPTGLAVFLLILITHRSNLKRLLRGNENRISFSGKDKKGEQDG